MTHRMLLAAFVVGLLAWGGLSARTEDKKAAGSYVHTVIFFVKDDAPKGAIDAMIDDAHGLLTKIPTVRDLKIGRPAKQSTPEVSVKDYQVGLVVLFDDFDGLDKYLKHPQHDEYVNRHLKHMNKVVVYDFIGEKK